MGTGLYVVIAALVLAVAVGLILAATDGRFRGTHAVRRAGPDPAGPEPDPRTAVLAGTRWAEDLGERVTLVQFSTAFCAPCRAARRVLEDVARTEPGVRHVEIDAEHHLDVVRRLGILRTPTTLVLDAGGREVSRASGAPTKAQVVAAVSAVADRDPGR